MSSGEKKERYLNRAIAAIRWHLGRLIPAHIRFQRAGKAFVAHGEREVALLTQLVNPDSIAIDVGANIGSFSFALLKCLGPSGRIIAIEPIPELAAGLAIAIHRLNLPVELHVCAVSDRSGEGVMDVPRHGRPLYALARLRFAGSENTERKVAIATLDEIAGNLDKRVSFVKIDVEGHELRVLRGGEQMIRKHRPNMLIEIEDRHNPGCIPMTFEYLHELGYEGWFLDADGNICAISDFDIDMHQRRRIGEIGTRFYVSNFIFAPRAADGWPRRS